MALSGQFDLSDATEGVALANTTDVASFSDTNLSDTTSSFTATIDWGDGTTTLNATIVGSNGHFTVEGGHTYADENQYPAVVTITRTADSSQLIVAGTVPVADADVFSNLHGATISYTPNAPLTNVTVATFSDSYLGQVASDFTAQIDWGDGTVTSGTVQGSNGSFSIVGSHTYTAAGEFTVSVSFADDAPDAASGFVSSTAVSGFGGQVTLTSATEGTALTGTEVATFADTSGSHAASAYTANIDWGDGTTTSGTISGSGQSFTVTGTHTYIDEEGNEITGDPPLMKVIVTRTADNMAITASGAVAVADADVLTMTSKTIGTTPNTPLTNVTVATFTDAYTGQIAGDLKATIDWGDGSTTDVGTITGSAGSFTVTGSHTYTSNGADNINVSILEDQGQIGFVTSKANIGLAPGNFLLTAITEGDANSHNVATFNDGNTSDTTSAFTASIDWGDGTTTAGTISGASGAFTVSGIHAYADEGDQTPIVTVTRTADSETATMSGTTSVGEGDSFSLTVGSINAEPGKALTNVQLATFTDTYTGQVASDLAATIDWGDGTTSAGTIAGGSGSFTVNGTHTYTAGGSDTFKVTVTDDLPGTATASATGTATVNLAGHMALTNATEGTALANNTSVATFSDSNGGDTPASFTATIEWGDGTTSAGTVSGGAGTFTVSGGHTYTDEGNDTAKVVLTRTADGATSTVSGSVAVAEGDSLTGHAVSFTTHAHQAFSGTVATFDDTYTANVPGDFTATIDWGDGTTSTGTVSGGSGTFTVAGSHTYLSQGQDNVTVTLRDDAPGTASATATSTATVGFGAVPKNDFNGDNKSDLLLQNSPFVGNPDVMIELLNGLTVSSSGTIPTPPGWHVEASGDFNHDNKEDIILQNNDGAPEIWLMNGTSVTSTVLLANPGPSWHVIAAADFNKDGNPDILWQNTNGAAAIWLMNGTTPNGGGVLPVNPGPTWRVIGAGDVNGDGNADILWQNNDGTPAIWEMNGTNVIGGGLLVNPGTSWHAIGLGDFNGDGNADILWQNNDGAAAIWELNGTNIIGGGVLSPNPGASWHVIGTSDFNGDGKADILWQNNDGTPAIWDMNGTTVIGGGLLPNPGATWQAKADGPIPIGGMDVRVPDTPPAPHLSSPDPATDGAPTFGRPMPPFASSSWTSSTDHWGGLPDTPWTKLLAAKG
jgi:FG-GAP-like repeat